MQRYLPTSSIPPAADNLMARLHRVAMFTHCVVMSTHRLAMLTHCVVMITNRLAMLIHCVAMFTHYVAMFTHCCSHHGVCHAIYIITPTSFPGAGGR